jgi:ceramide synthetase
MMSHHIVTIALVTWSYAVGFLPVGVIVLLLHDVSDVPLDLLKMANYLKLEGVKGLFVTETLYVIVLGTWIYMRIYLYPSKLLYTTLFENREATMAASVAHDFTILFPNPGPPYWLIFNIWMIALYCLHIWWGFLLLRILIRISSSSVHDAGKDEYEGSSESSESEKED